MSVSGSSRCFGTTTTTKQSAVHQASLNFVHKHSIYASVLNHEVPSIPSESRAAFALFGIPAFLRVCIPPAFNRLFRTNQCPISSVGVEKREWRKRESRSLLFRTWYSPFDPKCHMVEIGLGTSDTGTAAGYPSTTRPGRNQRFLVRSPNWKWENGRLFDPTFAKYFDKEKEKRKGRKGNRFGFVSYQRTLRTNWRRLGWIGQ